MKKAILGIVMVSKMQGYSKDLAFLIYKYIVKSIYTLYRVLL